MEHLTTKALRVGAKLLPAAALGLFLSTQATAQLTGFSAELDTMLWETDSPDDPLADLAYYGVYKVYANFTNADDVVSAVYSDVSALGDSVHGN